MYAKYMQEMADDNNMCDPIAGNAQIACLTTLCVLVMGES